MSGIWQTVWLEAVPATSIADIKLTPDVDGGMLRLAVLTRGGSGADVEAVASDGGQKVAMASVMLSFLMMITRRKAIPQVIGFLSMENGLLFAATSATYGMPMVVELGIALDVLVGVLILGVFFFQIREQFDSLDLKHLEKLKEGE